MEDLRTLNKVRIVAWLLFLSPAKNRAVCPVFLSEMGDLFHPSRLSEVTQDKI